MRLFLSTVLLLGCALACGPPAEEAPPAAPPPSEPPASASSGLEISEPRAQVLPNGMGAAYFSVLNPGTEADRLVSVASAAAKVAEIHESVEEGGVMRMTAHPDGFEIPAGATLVLEPGGKHVMLMELTLPEGAESLPMTLRFERAGEVETELPILQPGETDHGDMEH